MYMFHYSQPAYDAFLKMFLAVYNECVRKITVTVGIEMESHCFPPSQ